MYWRKPHVIHPGLAGARPLQGARSHAGAGGSDRGPAIGRLGRRRHQDRTSQGSRRERYGRAAARADFQNLHRNKRSLTLNLKEPDGVAIFKRMVETADVVIENYRPDVKFRLGVDYETIRAINKRIVYGSISGFGEDGPYRERPGFDQIAQGMGGLMSITGLPGQGPVRVGIPVADLGAGIFCAM